MNDVSNRTDCVNDADYQTLMLCDIHNYICYQMHCTLCIHVQEKTNC